MLTTRKLQLNAVQEKSLRLIDEMFKSISPDSFLKEYDEIEKNTGPTIDGLFITQPGDIRAAP